jgi:hypothetical protein
MVNFFTLKNNFFIPIEEYNEIKEFEKKMK